MIKRLFVFGCAYFLRRSLPHGVVNWRYLRLNLPEQVRIHRRLWLLGRHPRIPLPIYLFIELLLWLRWVLFTCWRLSWRMIQMRGSEITTGEGIGKTTLLLRLLAMGLHYCIPPGEIIAFGLYRRNSQQDVWNYIFSHEAQAFHRWRDLKPGEVAEALAMIQDKLGLAGLLAAHGIPMAPFLAVIPRATQFDPGPYLHDVPRIFCKPRYGSASRDNFVIEQGGPFETATIFSVKNGMRAQPSDLATLHKAMSSDDFLIQPFLSNHPLLAPLLPTEDAITVRIITELHQADGPHCYCATLEIPNPDNGSYCHTILPLDISTGQPCPFPVQRLPAPARARHDATLARVSGCTIPFWAEIIRSAMVAHQQLPGLYAIAWDYVITGDGPRMLEGNSGWGTTTPQILCGGMLRKALEQTELPTMKS